MKTKQTTETKTATSVLSYVEAATTQTTQGENTTNPITLPELFTKFQSMYKQMQDIASQLGNMFNSKLN